MTFASLVLAASFACPMERVDSLDPAKAQSSYDARAVSLVYETPLEIDYSARPYALAPGLCELPEVSEDRLKYVFKMAKGAPLKSGDVKRAIDRLRDPDRPSPGRWTVKRVASTETPDDETLVVTLSSPQHVFPWMLALANCAVPAADGSGTGPYRLASWWRNHEMVFVRNPDWRGWAATAASDAAAGVKPYDEIRYLVIDDPSTAWLMFLRGEIDWMGTISRDNWSAVVDKNGRATPELESAGKLLCGGGDAIEIRYIGFNMEDPVVGKNKKLRQALSCAFDFEAWSGFYNNSIASANGPVPRCVAGRLETPSPYGYDPEKAKRLLAEAGYPGGIDPATGRRLVLTLSIGRPTQDSREAGELIAGFFAKAGVLLELDFRTWESFLSAVCRGETQMYMMAWVGDYPDAENFLQLFHSSNHNPGPNHSNYSSTAFDRLYDAAMSEPDEARRNELWRESQKILQEDCPWIFTHITRNYSLADKSVLNYIPSDFPYGFEKYLRTAK